MSVPFPDHNTPAAAVHFGGPDRPERALRDLLQRRIEAVPSDGWIVWVTYYFRDEALAHALVAAHRRGVSVRVAVEGEPRRANANDAVLAILRAGLPAEALHIAAPPFALLASAYAHLHCKIYAFSHPSPTALVGSFNPSGNEPEDPAVIAEIGDQDRGHNLLVELRDPLLVGGLAAQVSALSGLRGSLLGRLLPAQNRMLRSGATRIWHFPRLGTAMLGEAFRLDARDSVRGVISHLKLGRMADLMIEGARGGAQVELLVHDTQRRVSDATIAALTAAGIGIRRYRHPRGLPLHAKFLIVERQAETTAWFGSFNFNPRSRSWGDRRARSALQSDRGRNRALPSCLAPR